jgi:hypothetical protein
MSSGAPIEQGIPVRMPSTALLCANTADAELFARDTGERVDNNFPNQLYINRGRPLAFGYMTRVALTEVCLQWDTPNVNANNNTITIAVNNLTTSEVGTLRSTIDIGWYKPSELADEIQAQLNADWDIFLNISSGPAWAVDVNPETLQVSISALTPTVPGDFDDFVFYIVPPTDKTVGLPALQQDLTNMLGLTPSQEIADFWSTIRGGYASFQYTPYIDIVSNLLTKNQNVADGDTSLRNVQSKLCRLYLANEEIVNRTEDNIVGSRPFVFKREFMVPKQIQWNNTENVDVIDISVLDSLGNPVYISPIFSSLGEIATVGNTNDFFFTVQITEV